MIKCLHGINEQYRVDQANLIRNIHDLLPFINIIAIRRNKEKQDEFIF